MAPESTLSRKKQRGPEWEAPGPAEHAGEAWRANESSLRWTPQRG